VLGGDAGLSRGLWVSVALVGVALVAVIVDAPATARVPDPLKPGELGVNVVEYEAGEIALTVPQLDGTSASFTQPLEGSVTFPTGPGPWPVVLFLHGRHQTCIDAGGAEYIPEAGSAEVPCPDVFGPNGQQLQTRIRSYAGYGYLASLLASRGYAVVSPSANVIASFDGAASDRGIAARTQVIGATLDLMRRWSNGAGPSVAGDPGHTIGTRLTGRLDLTRVALMGHSRGAEGVTQFIAFNRERSTVYPLNGVISVAAIATGVDPFRDGGANLAELLPACDGDVFFLGGGHVFERVKYTPQGRRFTKLQWLVQGTNHNFFNTVWTGIDDALENPLTAGDSACGPASPNTVRLDPADQRRVGIALMASFIRYFEGGERRFGKIVTGAAYPQSACPRGSSVPCDALVRASAIAPKRRTVIEPGGSEPTRRNALGGAIRANRLSLELCDPTQIPVAGLPPGLPLGSAVIPCPGPARDLADLEELLELLGGQAVPPQNPVDPLWVNRSSTPQLVATWSGRSALSTTIPPRFANVHRFRNLVLRSVTTLSRRNPAAVDNEAGPATQRYDVVLVDRHGEQDRVPAERFSTALEPALGDSMRQLILSDVRIPLRRFDGVDTRHLAAVKLRFGVRGRRRGQVQISDLAFQGGGGGREAAPAATPAAVHRGPGTAVDAIPLDAVTDPAGVAGCGDSTAPTLGVERAPTLAGGRLSTTGRAADAGCSGLARVQVAVTDRVDNGCRFLGPDGELGPVSDCAHPYALIAAGGTRWSLELEAVRLPEDAEAAIWALDRAGNTSSVRRFAVR
jgi:hypothetical protein